MCIASSYKQSVCAGIGSGTETTIAGWHGNEASVWALCGDITAYPPINHTHQGFIQSWRRRGGHYCARVPVVCLTFSPSKDLYKTLHTHAVIHTHTYTHSHTYADSRQNLQTKGSWKSEVQEAQE